MSGERGDSGVAARPDGRAVALVFVGGGVGSVLRWGLGSAVPDLAGVPVGILVVNLVGAALLGALVEILDRRVPDAGQRRELRLALGTGVLGGFTTYSALATGAADLVSDGRIGVGVGYALATVGLGALATVAGMGLGRGGGEPA